MTDRSFLQFQKFFRAFLNANGAVSTVVITVSLSFALGCTVAIVPEILTDRYARLRHDYDWEIPCSAFDDTNMPIGCRHGADDAQDASAWSSLLQNGLTLFLNPVVGKMSDVHGRRKIFTVGIFTYMLAPIVLVWMQIDQTVDPIFYYLASSGIGVVSFSSIAFAIISDTVPEEFRTASFGVVMAAFYSGFALSPFLAILLNHLQVSVLSSGLTGLAFVYTLLCFPETLPDHVRERNQSSNISLDQEQGEQSVRKKSMYWIRRILTRPFREMKILNRDKAIRLVSIGSFFSSMVYATDANLVIFYVEEYLDVRENDIAYQFLVMGLVGVLIQGFLLQPLLQCFGEKKFLIISFLSGTLHNFLYGVAKNKQSLYVALSLSQLTKTNTPILASLASKDASVHEQGQLQGALYAMNALSAALGPLFMQAIYQRTKDTVGPGTMFLFASFLYFVGTIIVSFIPVEDALDDIINSGETEELERQAVNDLEEPLLSQNQTESE